MNFPKKVFEEALADLKQPASLSSVAKQILPLIDLTTLSADDTDEKILALCAQAQTPYGNVAAVCIYSKFVPLAKKTLKNTSIKVATVVNFPTGNLPIAPVTLEIKNAVASEADEIDVVFPYRAFLDNHKKESQKFVQICKDSCPKGVSLKVILETGAFPNVESIYEASALIIDAGADFLKTSTGKIETGATIEAATAMLLAIKQSKKSVGFKASGSVRDVKDAYRYLSSAEHIMGKNWINPKTFRFGASALLKDTLANLAGQGKAC